MITGPRFVLIAVLATAAAPALADRPPRPPEHARIEGLLRAEGFARWKDIGFGDRRWEIEDAIAADGHDYDLRLSVETFATIRRVR